MNNTEGLKVGETFLSDGSRFTILSVERRENNNFYWHKITAIWCGFGRMPLWHNETRNFYTAHKPK